MSTELAPDLCVIGGGPGGLTAALGAAAAGKSVAVVEKSALGGRRLSESIPRHTLLAAARAADKACRIMEIASNGPQPRANFALLRQEIAAIVAAISPNYSKARLEAMNVKVISATGRFVRPDRCEAGTTNIKAERFVIATGTVAGRLPVPGLDTVRPLDCAALCALDQPPERLLVIGAEPEGLALAQAVRRLGSEVVIISGKRLFAAEDEELAEPVRAAFDRDGIEIHEGMRISRIEPRGQGVRLFVAAAGRESQILGSHLFLAPARVPAVEGIGLAAAGVRYDAGGIKTNARFRTSNWRIYAIGAAVKGAGQGGPPNGTRITRCGTYSGCPARERPECRGRGSYGLSRPLPRRAFRKHKRGRPAAIFVCLAGRLRRQKRRRSNVSQAVTSRSLRAGKAASSAPESSARAPKS